MLSWIKRWFNYRAKYNALLNERNEAAKHAIDVMGRYDALCASLPKDHELSTQFRWQAFANHHMMYENSQLSKKVDALTEINNSMVSQWTDAIYKYGVHMVGKWQPMDIAPKDGREILVAHNGGITIARWYADNQEWVYQHELLSLDSVASPTHWMPLPEPPKGDSQ